MKEYCFVPNLDDPKLLSVRLTEGDYAGTVFTIRSVKATRDDKGDIFETDMRYECVLRKGKLMKKIAGEVGLKADVDEIIQHVITTMLDNFSGEEVAFGDSEVE